jgi:hypothetical protein
MAAQHVRNPRREEKAHEQLLVLIQAADLKQLRSSSGRLLMQVVHLRRARPSGRLDRLLSIRWGGGYVNVKLCLLHECLDGLLMWRQSCRNPHRPRRCCCAGNWVSLKKFNAVVLALVSPANTVTSEMLSCASLCSPAESYSFAFATWRCDGGLH